MTRSAAFRPPATRIVFAVVLAVLLGSCTSIPRPASHSPGPRSTTYYPREFHPPTSFGAGWQRVDIDGSVRTIAGQCSGVLAAGLGNGLLGLGPSRPLLVDVVNGTASAVKGQIPSHQALAGVAVGGEDVIATEEVDPALGKPAALLLSDYSTAFPQVTSSWEQIWDADGAIPVWLSPLFSDEEGFGAVGAARARGRWELHAWRDVDKWERLDWGRPLFALAKPSSQSVLTASTAFTLVVTGAISDRPGGSGGSPQVWAIDYSGEDPDADPGDGRWTQHRMASTPDGLTDVGAWELGWWVAGHRHLRPVVYDFDRHEGASLPVPNTLLDPHHPVVYVAGPPISHPMVLATQSADGPTVWVRKGRTWLRIPAPEGSLTAAKSVDRGVYLVIDGALWFRALREVEC